MSFDRLGPTSAPFSFDPDLDIVARHPYREAPDSLLSGRSGDRTRLHIESRAVPRTSDLVSGQLSLGQGSALVRADVVDGVVAPTHTEQGDAPSLDLDEFPRARCLEVCPRSDPDESSHDLLLSTFQ